MARLCKICGKGLQRGNKVSHANNKSPKVWLPNLHKARVIENGTVRKINVCTSCLKANKIIKPPVRQRSTNVEL